MKAVFLAFLSLIPLVIRSQELAIDLAGQGSSGWQLIGQQSSVGEVPGSFSLAPDSQLFRTFAAEPILVEVSSTPVFGVEPAEWPVLEFGAHALVFARSGDKGRLVLTSDANPPFVFPPEFELEKDGQSSGSVLLTIERSGPNLLLTLNGDSWRIPSEGPTAAGVEVVVSSGRSDPWPFERFSVQETPAAAADSTPAGVSQGQADSESNSEELTVHGGNAQDTASFTLTAERATPRTPNASIPGADTAQSSTASFSLEIFTPPSVRHGRSGTARVDAAQVLTRQTEGVR